MKTSTLAVLSALLLGVTPIAHAGLGSRVVVVDSELEVGATFLDGAGAGNINILFLESAFPVMQLFNNQLSIVNETVGLGFFVAGTELVFRIASDDGSNVENWYTGPADRNVDNIAHAVLTDLGNNTVQVEFEDLRGGGDSNYRDMVFSVSNATLAPIPEPETYALMLAGLALVAWGGRRRIGRGAEVR